jgi:hypothetical protein
MRVSCCSALVRLWQILLQKSFCTRDQNFFWLYTRLSCKDVGTLSGSCRGVAVTISPRIFHLRMRRSSGVSLSGEDLGFIRASIGWTLPIYDP